MVKVVIFDFDLTLFDSAPIKHLMDKREWSLVYNNISNCMFYPKAIDAIRVLNNNEIKTAIVSNAPSTYVKKVLTFYNVNIDFIVCYHDVNNHKPSPEGILKVLNYFSIKNNEAIYIGDNDIDNFTANNAHIDFYGVPWGVYTKKVNVIDYNNFIKYINSKKNKCYFSNSLTTN